jgi:ribosomal protein L37E
MVLMICPECGKEVSDKSKACVHCGFPMSGQKPVHKNKWSTMRKSFGIADLVIGIMFLIMILSSEGGIANTSRMMGASWFFIWCGILSLLEYVIPFISSFLLHKCIISQKHREQTKGLGMFFLS